MLFCSIEVPGDGGTREPGLREAKGLVGLPSLAFLDAEGDVLITVPFAERTIDGLRHRHERARDYLRLRAAAADDPVAAGRFLRMQLEEGQLGAESAHARRRALPADLDADLLAAIDLSLLDLDVSAALAAAGQQGRHELGPRFLRMLREGPRPSARVSRGFWYAMLEWAERARDCDAFAEALDGMQRALEVTDRGAAWVEPLLERYRKQLAAMRRQR